LNQPVDDLGPVGVVVPVHNTERFLATTLTSVAEQTRQDWICIVVDDGSQDESLAVAQEFAARDPRFEVVGQPQGGVSAARNAGLRRLAGRAPTVVFLDSDDLLLPTAFADLSKALDARPDAVGISAVAEFVDEGGAPVDPGVHSARMRTRVRASGGNLRVVPPEEDSTFEALCAAGRIFPPATVMLRTPVVEAVGGFDEELVTSEDWDLFLRASRRGPIAFLDQQVVWYRRRSGSLTADNFHRAVYFIDLVRFKACASGENTPEQRDAAIAAWRAVQREAARYDLADALQAVRSRQPIRSLRSLRNAVLMARGSLAPSPAPPRRSVSQRRSSVVAVVQPERFREPA
jgi:glycosyltransferase involved in cell wall biosynthesis